VAIALLGLSQFDLVDGKASFLAAPIRSSN
jgi:hypothetical protein